MTKLTAIFLALGLGFASCGPSVSEEPRVAEATAPVDPCKPQPTPLPPPSSPAKSVMAEINRVRAQRGLPAVAELPALNCAALRHAKDIAPRKVCTHTGSDGSTPWDRAKSCGTFANGEIVACGHQSAAAAVVGWTNSPGHAAIMFDPAQKRFGAAMEGNYWVVIFQK